MPTPAELEQKKRQKGELKTAKIPIFVVGVGMTRFGRLLESSVYDMVGEDAKGNILGRHRSTGIGRPRFWERARYYGEEQRLAVALDAAEASNEAIRA